MNTIKKIKKSKRFMAAMRNVLMVDLFFMFNYIENIERSLAYCRRVSSSNKQEKPDGSKVKLVRCEAEVMHASAIKQLTKGKNYEGKEIARLVAMALDKDYKHSSPNKASLLGLRYFKEIEIYALFISCCIRKSVSGNQVQELAVKILNLTIVSAGRPDIVLEIPDSDNPKGLLFTLKEVDSSKEILRTFGPQAEPYIHVMLEEVTPS
nr:hypothetical protein [Tanacetum cinerariifolium]